MQPESAKYLEDIREAGRTILEIAAGRTLADYVRDKVLRLAVERCFETSGCGSFISRGEPALRRARTRY